MKKRTIELLAPAKNIACGIEAIKHGADAVYIGAPKFGARSSAGNSIEDIRNLVAFAHQFNAKIYVTLNTILRDEEIGEAEELIRQLYYANVDALIVQDMAVLKMNIPPIAIHASTQTDNRTVEKVQFLANAGFSQVVLARELSLNEIRTIHENCKVALECFIHGALCVSYSGQCYISHAFTGRSANRGECAQFCRLPYNLIDAEGKRIETQKHLLSLKDMNRSKYIEDLIEAGVSSFKIEGRLKDISYVKNVTAFYRKAIDAVLEKRSDCKRSSRGISEISFTPNIYKTFNREYTDYYMNDRDKEVANYGTPKFKGEYIGSVVKCEQKEIRIKSDKKLANGDGLVFFDSANQLKGFRVNKVEGDTIYTTERIDLKRGTLLYRNHDFEFNKELDRETAKRTIPIDIELYDTSFGLALSLDDTLGNRVIVSKELSLDLAQKDQTDNIVKQLSKLGNTNYSINSIAVTLSCPYFIPTSLLNEMRREAIEKLDRNSRINYHVEYRLPSNKKPVDNNYFVSSLSYLGNVSNTLSKRFYAESGVEHIDDAFEQANGKYDDQALMFTKHCLRYSFGWCPKYQKTKSPFKEPYFLEYNNTQLRLEFDCKHCQMIIYKK